MSFRRASTCESHQSDRNKFFFRNDFSVLHIRVPRSCLFFHLPKSGSQLAENAATATILPIHVRRILRHSFLLHVLYFTAEKEEEERRIETCSVRIGAKHAKLIFFSLFSSSDWKICPNSYALKKLYCRARFKVDCWRHYIPFGTHIDTRKQE